MKLTVTNSFWLLFGIATMWLSSSSHGVAQLAGSRAQVASSENQLTPLTPSVANSHIAVEGTAQQRVKPTSMRLIWAVTSEAEDAIACNAHAKIQIAKTMEAWRRIGIDSKAIVTDYISAIPQFEFLLKDSEAESVLVETQTGFRLQSNLHVAVSSESQGLEVIDAALESGLTDLIGVDYSADLRAPKQAAMLDALAAAKEKSKLLLEVFAEAPKPLNIQEQTRVYFPSDLYESFENVADQATNSWWSSNERRVIHAYRPKNTYYKGLPRDADRRTYALAMHPEIIIESRVVLYYQSPNHRPQHEPAEK